MSPKAMSDADYAALSERVKHGPRNAYAQGKRLEYKVINELRALGFVTMRSAGSKGAVDVIALRPGELLLVQVKRTTPPGPAAWNALFDMASWVSGVPILATCLPYRAIAYERLVFRKPFPRPSPRARPPLEPSGRVPYPLSATVELQEAEPEDETEGETDHGDRW